MKISDFAILAVRVSMKTSENWLLEYWADNKTSVTVCCRNWLNQWWPSVNWYFCSVVPASLECVCFCVISCMDLHFSLLLLFHVVADSSGHKNCAALKIVNVLCESKMVRQHDCVLQNDVGAWHHNGGVPAGHAGTARNGWGSGVTGGSDMLAGQRGALVSTQQTSVSCIYYCILFQISWIPELSRWVAARLGTFSTMKGDWRLIKMRFFFF